jgi:hypothetical protein
MTTFARTISRFCAIEHRSERSSMDRLIHWLQLLLLVMLMAWLLLMVPDADAQLEKNVGIGTNNPDNSALLELLSSTQGLLAPRMTEMQKVAIASPDTSLILFQTDFATIAPYAGLPQTYWYYDGLMWRPFLTVGTAWSVLGNAGTIAGPNFLGTVDAVDLRIRTNNTFRWTVRSTGEVGINTTTPTSTFQVQDGNILLENTTNSASQIRFAEPSSSGSNFTSIKSPALVANVTYNWSDTQGVSRTAVTTDGIGNLYWQYYSATPQFNVVTAATLTSATDNWVIQDDATLLRVCATGNYDLTGIAGGRPGRVLIVCNVCTTGNIILREENASSLAANRLILSANQFQLSPNDASMFIYDSFSSRWRLVMKTP